MRSVLVVEEHPDRSHGGIALRNAAAAYALAQLGELVLVGVGDPAGEGERSRLGEVRAVGLGHRPAHDDDWVDHPDAGRWSPAALDAFDALLAEVRPDVVVAEQLWLHACLPVARDRGALTVLDAHNVEAHVYAAVAEVSGDPRDQRMARATADLEARVVPTVDQVWACSDLDAAHLGPRAVVVPNVVELAEPRDPAGVEPLLLYPGSFAYPPNVRAADVLVEQVLPAFAAEAPDGRVALVGHSPPRRLLARADEQVLVPGSVPSLRPWLERACAVVVPLTEGGGTRFKVLEAMAAGVPVVSTPKGVEGLDVEGGVHVLLADDGPGLAAAAVRLWQDRELAQSLAVRGRERVVQQYDWSAAARAVREAVARLPLRG